MLRHRGITERMKIVVASRNPVKLNAAASAFGQSFPGRRVEVVGLAVESGVSDQPMSDEETRRGARNRAHGALKELPDADYWVGLEGGIERVDDDLVTFAWMFVLGADGRRGQARTVTLTLPPAIRRLIDDGLELGDANDRVFGTRNSKHRGGAFGLLTDGRYTRESVYVEALCAALVPIVNEVYAR
jgi:inosine/xanthosine triphosphatase